MDLSTQIVVGTSLGLVFGILVPRRVKAFLAFYRKLPSQRAKRAIAEVRKKRADTEAAFRENDREQEQKNAAGNLIRQTLPVGHPDRFPALKALGCHFKDEDMAPPLKVDSEAFRRMFPAEKRHD